MTTPAHKTGRTELTYEESRLLERLSWVEYLSDYDRIPERVLVNTGLAERLPWGRIRITDAGRAALSASRSETK